MPATLPLDFAWWLSAVELPALAGLFWLVQRQRDMAVDLAAALAAYKLDVAQTYASISLLREVETRLTEHLLRIEAKLDQASLQNVRVRP